MQRSANANRKRYIAFGAGALILVALLVGGAAWVGWQIIDNIDAPGPPATGSGPCDSADSVNIQLTFGDGRLVQACTRDRPACSNQNTTDASQFFLNNQLRSSSRRYILVIRSDVAFAADMPEQTLQLDNGAFLPGAAPTASAPAHFVVQLTPRDPTEDAYTPVSGTLTMSSSRGVARGVIDASVGAGSPQNWPARFTGNFTCTS